ncbi:capsular biosynthesis protein [Pseudomonas sp. R2.Fl]|nr:capsular biosynthesis protein [Pseudomonas sp. R2.Fl]
MERMRRLALLLLQGPASPFLKQVAHAVEERGGTVHKINFCLGDAVFWWPRRASWFVERDDRWPEFLKRYILRHGITDILMLGDGRPKHAEAVNVAREMGIKAHIFEHGYLRPDWLTIEPFGMSSQSLLPRDLETLGRLAEKAAPPAPSSFRSSFLTYTLYDLAYHVPNVLLGWLVHPRYKTHGAVHPLVEYAGWIGKALRRRGRQRDARQIEQRYLGKGTRYFLFPLQLPGDYQIKRHAPVGDHFELVRSVLRSFAENAPPGSRLLFKIHPIDNGLSGWGEKIGRWARQLHIADRVDVIDGGNLDRLIAASAGVVTVNSTVGLTAVLADKPTITLGAAIYDLPGLTWQDSLARFWTEAAPPAPGASETFARALTATIQVRGGFIGKDAMTIGAENLVERLLTERDWVSDEARAARSQFRYAREIELLRGASA